MFKRIRWFTMGAVASLGGTWYARRWVARTRPGQVARRAGGRVTDAVREGRAAMEAKQAELEARARGPRPRPVLGGGRTISDSDVIELRDVVDVVPIERLQRAVRPGARAVSMRRATRSPR